MKKLKETAVQYQQEKNTSQKERNPKLKMSKIETAMYSIAATVSGMLITTENSFAAIKAFDSLKKTINEVFLGVRGIVLGIGALMLVLSLCMMFWPSEKSAEKGKGWTWRILAGIGCILALGAIISFMTDTTSGMGLTNLNDLMK